MTRHVLIATAGHVDHGKTTLVFALTGTDTDRLIEEKQRGLTIDLGFAHLSLPGGIDAGLVDVPGHERFVKNMLAGAGGIDLALVVVAADGGPMPQTREHLDILTVLGVEYGVVALTRCDLADPELRELAKIETRAALAKSSLADAPIVEVSAVTGEGLDTLRDALAAAAKSAPERDPGAPLRLPVDRVFGLPGVGTVVTGSLVSGTLKTGDPIALMPQNLLSKARTLQSHGERIESASPGMRVAVNCPGVEIGQIERGAVLCAPGSLAASDRIDVRLRVLPDAARPVRHRERVRVHFGAGEILARVLLLTSDTVEAGSDAPAQLWCETLAAPARGERFVLRTYSPARTIGGGVVLEPSPNRRYRRGDPGALALFDARASGGHADRVHAALAARHTDQSRAELSAALAIDDVTLDTALEELLDTRRAFVLPDQRLIADMSAGRLRETARRTLAAYHRQNPYRRAMARETLRAALAKAATVRDFAGLLLWLAAEDVLTIDSAHGVRLPEHEIVIPEKWQAAVAHLDDVYAAARFNSPSPRDFSTSYPRDIPIPAILEILVETGRLRRISDDFYLHAQTYAELLNHLRRLAASPEKITVGSLRDATNSSRKIVLPLLEYLDGIRVTRRIADNTRTLIDDPAKAVDG